MTKTLDLFEFTDADTANACEIVRDGWPCETCDKTAFCSFFDWQTCGRVHLFEEAELEVIQKRAFCVACPERAAKTCKYKKQEFNCPQYGRKHKSETL